MKMEARSSNKLAMMALLVVVLVAAIGELVVPCEATEPICGMAVADLLACEPAVVGTSPSLPSKSCCKALAKADLPCLCKFKTSNNPLGIPINPDLAMQLPVNCHLVPSFSC